MHWRIGPDGKVWGKHSASDGDEDMAMALLVACEIFGSADLCSDSPSMIQNLLDHDVDSTSAIKSGDSWGGCDAARWVVCFVQ